MINNNMKIRVWYDERKQMYYPKHFKLVTKPDSTYAVYKIGNTKVESNIFMTGITFETKIFYEGDIITFKYKDDCYEGLLGFNELKATYTIRTCKKEFYLHSCKEIMLKGNIYESPERRNDFAKKSKIKNSVEKDRHVDLFIRGSAAGYNDNGPVGLCEYVIKEGSNIISSSQVIVEDINSDTLASMNSLILALKYLDTDLLNLTINTDDKFLYDALSKWLDKWASSLYCKTDGTPVKNNSLWKEIYRYLVNKNINVLYNVEENNNVFTHDLTA